MAEGKHITKLCARCKATLHISMFNRSSRAKTGLKSYCKPCDNEYRRERLLKNPEKVRAAARAYRAANKDKVKQYNAKAYMRVQNDPQLLARLIAYRLSQKASRQEADRKRHDERREERIAAARKWNIENRSRYRSIKRAADARRRAVEKQGDPHPLIWEWQQSVKKVCYWCGVKCAHDFQIDHYVPLARGGRHEVANLVISCPSCNNHKRAKDPYKYAASLGRLF